MPPSGIYARQIPALDRYLQLGIASDRLLSVSFPATADPDASMEHPILDRMLAYFDGHQKSFQDVNVAITNPTPQRTVLETLRSIPYGEQVTVDRFAGMTPTLDQEAPVDHEQVRQSLTANPAPVIIPDHRVTDGPSAAPPAIREYCRDLENLS